MLEMLPVEKSHPAATISASVATTSGSPWAQLLARDAKTQVKAMPPRVLCKAKAKVQVAPIEAPVLEDIAEEEGPGGDVTVQSQRSDLPPQASHVQVDSNASSP